tara:strand:- start:5510 stop:6550 length:1041 start_codon:yes stop_codon:yes gene_type:complete
MIAMRIITTLLFSLGSIGQVYAHHGSAPHFDSNDIVSFEGVVTQVYFVNPHAIVHFEVSDSDGAIAEWRCELSGSSQLQRFGWSQDTLSIGDEIRIVGSRARREANHCDTRSIHLANGTNLSRDIYIQGNIRQSRIAKAADVASRPQYLENSQPNISGRWIVREGGENTLPIPTEAGRLAAERYDVRFDNPSIRCESGNIVWDWARQAHINDIHQEEGQILIRYGYLDLMRTIHLDITKHPENVVPSLEGHSIGLWDGDTLVIDTIGFLPRAFIPRESVMTSEEMHVVERISFDDELSVLVRDYVVTDPLYLAEPYSGRDIADLAMAAYQPYNCVDLSGENNRRPD